MENEMNQVSKMDTPAAQLPVTVTPMQMLQIAVEKGADLDQLQKLMDLQERWEATEARKAFVAAKAAFKANAPKLTKNKKVSFVSDKTSKTTEYDHATLDHIAETVGPVLSEHGLTYSWQTQQVEGGVIRVTCVLTHILGHSESVCLGGSPDQSGGKNNIQAVGSTVTYLQRYTLLSALGMATSESDDDGIKSEADPISVAQKDELTDLIKATGTDTKKFLAFFKTESLDALPAEKFNDARSMLNAKKRKAA